MNLTTKKLLIIIAALLSGMALMSSCFKQTAKGAKKAKAANTQQTSAEKGAKKAAKTSAAAVASAAFSDGKNSLNATRSGQNVNLNWHLDATGATIRQIVISRSSTGVGQRTKVAVLDAKATSYKDALPDANEYWYWVKTYTPDGKPQDIGPVKVGADRAGADRYINVADEYKASVTRTLESATLTWDFPEGEYKSISIVRSKRPGKVTFTDKSILLTTLAAKSQHTDALPNSNSEYWYSFQIILKSGEAIYKGPIKADYIKR